ncbi:carboxy terminal-processing peptidase [Marinimicrobium agarilyticum]|uniref:carboxy terminal-processing peptidase n=1 Tax=Marinimicrobium agarilyticum TaxID=306546 RepID=UPI00040A9355|nr:carboxy terminal-processing peptidase [Marinimicrobium agarilyticum]
MLNVPKFLRNSTTLLALLLSSSLLWASTLDPLEISDQHQAVAASVVQQLDKHHYREKALNDALSSDFLDNYLKTLDPSKSYFFQADIDGFNQHRKEFDNWLAKGNLEQAFHIFDVYRQRLVTRLESVIERLNSEEISYDFTKDETLVVDWEQAEWPKDKKTADELWHKRVKAGLLDLKLAGKELKESKELLQKRYSNQLRRVRQQQSEDAFEVIINSLTTLYDPHTNYLSPRTLENFNINMSLSLEGIGAVLQTEDEYTKVMRLVPAGPADKQGDLRPADRIIAVGQGDEGEMTDVVGWRLDEVVDQIRGKKGTIVRLEVLPAKAPADSTTKTITIKRDKVKLEEQAAKHEVFDLNSGKARYKIGVINVPTFYMDFEAYRKRDPNFKSTTRDVHKILQQLEKENVDGIVLDLRGNGGGSLQEATTLTDLFIDRGPVVQIRQTNELISRNYQSHSRAAYRGPLIVLIDRLSASASEIFAGAIQDYGRGIIVGSQSFGKGSVQSLVPVDAGQLKLTESKFYRVSGDSTQHRGVIPDMKLPSLVDASEVGESAYDNALPWDKIHAVPHSQYFDIDALMPQLNPAHEKRVAQNPDFIYLREQMELMARNDDRKEVSLNEKARRAEQEKLESQMLALENQRRKAKGLSLYESYEDIDGIDDEQNGSEDESATDEAANDDDSDTAKKDSDEEDDLVNFSARSHSEIDPEKDPFLNEAGFILIDFIEQLEAMNEKERDRVANW